MEHSNTSGFHFNHCQLPNAKSNQRMSHHKYFITISQIFHPNWSSNYQIMQHLNTEFKFWDSNYVFNSYLNHLLFSTDERKNIYNYRMKMNNDRIFIFEWNIQLNVTFFYLRYLYVWVKRSSIEYHLLFQLLLETKLTWLFLLCSQWTGPVPQRSPDHSSSLCRTARPEDCTHTAERLRGK